MLEVREAKKATVADRAWPFLAAAAIELMAIRPRPLLGNSQYFMYWLCG
jgi:hypothetical protein